MKEFEVNHTKIIFQNFDEYEITEEMAQSALKCAESNKENANFVIAKVIVTNQDGKAVFDVEYNDADQPKIGRIRRITGYLTGTTDRWNNAKRSELQDRVTHIG